MAENTKIEWATHSWSPWHGCANAVLPSGEAHPGCDHCYAEAMARRNPGTLGVWGEGGTRVVSANWDKPRRWNEQAAKEGVRYRVFPSICDPFEEFLGTSVLTSERIKDEQGNVIGNAVAWWRNDIGVCRAGQTTVDHSRGERLATLNDVRRDFFRLIDETPNLDWLLLTKRPQNVLKMWPHWTTIHSTDPAAIGTQRPKRLDNAWLLASVSNQATADALVPELLKCRDLVPVLGLSVEPLLGPINLSVPWEGERTDPTLQVEWVIVGGESGPHARPMNPAWASSIRDQCQAAGVPFFFKQWGEWSPEIAAGAAVYSDPDTGALLTRTGRAERSDAFVEYIHDDAGRPVDYRGEYMERVGKKAAGRELDGRTWDEFPEVAR